MSANSTYQKEDELRRRINTFLQNTFQLPESDYYARLDLKSLLSLKSALSDINNTMTMRLTLSFLDWASKVLSFDAEAIAKIRESVLNTKPSSNGYDIHCFAPVPFIAEVKCNIPVNGGKRYGAAQREGILRDIDSLLNGKSKASPITLETLKFMVFIDLPEVREANAHLLGPNSKMSQWFQFLGTHDIPHNPAVVYGVYVAINS